MQPNIKNWIEVLKVNLPQTAEDLAANLDLITTSPLDEIDAHSCALAAAMATGNGELVFEMSMSEPLFGNPIRESVAKAVYDESINSLYDNFLRMAAKPNVQISTTNSGFSKISMNSNGGTTKEKYMMFSLAAAICNRSQSGIEHYSIVLKGLGVSQDKIHSIVKIATTVATIGKVFI